MCRKKITNDWEKIPPNLNANAGSVELFLLPYVRSCFNVVNSPPDKCSIQQHHKE